MGTFTRVSHCLPEKALHRFLRLDSKRRLIVTDPCRSTSAKLPLPVFTLTKLMQKSVYTSLTEELMSAITDVKKTLHAVEMPLEAAQYLCGWYTGINNHKAY